MAISTEKLKPASERFMLIKVTPGRYINDDLSDDGGGEYSITFPFPYIETVKRNGTALTLVTSFTGNDQYKWDGSTLTVKLAAAPSSTNIVIAFYNIYLTGTQARYFPKDPESAESASNEVVEWLPRVDKYPSISQTIRNISEGILSYSASSLSIINEGYYFDQYLTDNDSFSNKDIRVWQCINTVDNIQLVFAGKIKNISYDSQRISFTVFDPFSKFSQNAYMGDTDETAIFQRQAGSFADLNPSNNGDPFPYWTNEVFYNKYIIAVNPPLQYIRESPIGVCIDADVGAVVSSSNNRVYALCRVGPNGLKTINFGTTVRNANYSTRVGLYFLTGDNLKTHDPIKNGAVYGYVAYRGDTFTYSGQNYNCVIENITAGSSNPPANLASISTYECPPTIYHDSGGFITLLWWGEHYTWGKTELPSGNYAVYVTLNSGATSPETYWSLDPIDPNSQLIHYKLEPADTFTHAEFIEKLCNDVGISVNAASFAAADASLSANVHISIPNINKTTYRPISGYIEDVLRSTGGYLTINKDFEAEYHLLDTPAGTGEQVDDTSILQGSLKESIDYNDIKTTIIAKNPHVPVETGEETFERVDSLKSRHLNEIDVTLELTHCLDDISGRIDDLIALRSSRKKGYSFEVATQLVDSIIGDDVTLSDRTANVKITNIQKNGSKVSIDAEDLGDL